MSDRLRVGKKVRILEIGLADSYAGNDDFLKYTWTIVDERPRQSSPGYVSCYLVCKELPILGEQVCFYAVKLKLVGAIGRNPL